MRRLLAMLALAGNAACGDFSNEAVEDLSFVQALPRAEQLRLAAPEAVVDARADGLATTTQGLRICSRPLQQEAFCDGVGMARNVNAFTALVLGTLDVVRTLPPSERGADRRVWGPFADREMDRERRVVIERGPGEAGWAYRWAVQLRRADAPWVPLLEGTFVPGARGAASRGTGFFTWDPAEARLAGLEEEGDSDRLEIRYDLRGAAHVEADAVFDRPDLPATLRFVQDAHADGGGSWAWAFPWQFEGVEHLAQIEVRARWQQDRSGRSDARIFFGGPLQATIGNELCWDERLERTYFRSDDVRQCADGICPEGDVESCAFPALF